MKSPQRVVWSEGMFMSPHHLQQMDIYHEALLDTRLGSLEPYPWGVVSQSFDMESLRAGLVQLSSFTGILPDGLPVSLQSGDPEAPAARPADGAFPPAQRVLDVFIGVPRERSGVESYGGTDKVGGSPRYTPSTRPISDLTSSTSIVPVSFGQRNVRLLFGTEQRDDYEAIKIAELERDKAGNLTLVPSYIPPCLRIDASSSITNELRTLLRLLVSKQRQLSSRRRHRDASALEFTASDVTLFLELNALNGIIPVVQHALDAGNLRPQSLYLLLSQFAGQLCTFAVNADPSTLPAFQFINLRATFEELFRRIGELMHAVALEQCLTVAMEAGADRLFRGKLEDERLERCGQFLLTIRSDLPEKVVAEQLPKLSKMASWGDIQGLVQAAAPGVPLEVTYRPPPEVPVRPGVVYFTLALQDGYWKNALRDRTLALYLPQPFDVGTTSVELLAVPTSNR
ncbi:type VI secretion system baseplate subunit TssK [Corallococcus praedator]|uniref:Type VI secretion system baseplate subunit TssK n=1 Tax=Corallococcus praedator TaxID=2316724 RepID=A0ABX9QJJ9_9BACT|nr:MULTISPECIES: type VI secretion system baseplate subunit TssK [Corallococcus]RKH16361.1 type VI secretion system baseplate subunit TssK [Corallococcus sp. CA047B]RKH29469.1 type VI secretion system baseplate subunit TssK [Corallococcus sp. CA031C]RKI08732.1 type VI secretion system baseplate subunit TssK [Corallococcus praedator]